MICHPGDWAASFRCSDKFVVLLERLPLVTLVVMGILLRADLIRAEMPLPDRAPAEANERDESRGSLIIMGGSERFDNRVIWTEIVKQAGGEGSRIAVFPTASGAPVVDGEDVVRILNEEGADAFLVPLAIRGFDNDYREVARPAVGRQRPTVAGRVLCGRRTGANPASPGDRGRG